VKSENFELVSPDTKKPSHAPKMLRARSPRPSLPSTNSTPPLVSKVRRLAVLSDGAAALIERLVDDMLDELEGRRPQGSVQYTHRP